MKRIVIIAMAVLVAVCATAQAQDLKPVKDKNTKLFGYQDKDKNWVIEPAYTAAKRFKEGLAEVTIKPGKTKFHGIIDETGRVTAESITEIRRNHVFRSGEGLWDTLW